MSITGEKPSAVESRILPARRARASGSANVIVCSCLIFLLFLSKLFFSLVISLTIKVQIATDRTRQLLCHSVIMSSHPSVGERRQYRKKERRGDATLEGRPHGSPEIGRAHV